MSLPSINFLHLTVSEIQPGQTFSRRPPAHPETMGENNKEKWFVGRIVLLDTVCFKNFDEIALSCTVKETKAIWCFALLLQI